MNANQKVLIATDVPFWRRSTGAEQRIASLVRFMQSSGKRVKVFYLATAPVLHSDEAAINRLGNDVQVRSSDQVPKQVLHRIRWWIEATRNQYLPSSSEQAAKRENADYLDDHATPTSSDAPSTQLADYDWPWARRAFAELVGEFQPDVILIEYVKLAYLIQALTKKQRARICCAIDTHDLLHQRCELFRQHGCRHWIEINRDEESEVLNQFDVVVAIQADEAHSFREMTSGPRVIVCPHVVYANPAPQPTTRKRSPVVGFLASRNPANSIALETFIDRVWIPRQALTTQTDRDAAPFAPRLLIGGTVCQSSFLQSHANGEKGIDLLGSVDQLETFYSQIDLAVNPVEFGSGLKIKSIEALAFGKPLITTPHGAQGLDAMFHDHVVKIGSIGPIMIYQSMEEFWELYRAFGNPSVLQSVSQDVIQVAKTDLSAETLYSELNQVLFAN